MEDAVDEEDPEEVAEDVDDPDEETDAVEDAVEVDVADDDAVSVEDLVNVAVADWRIEICRTYLSSRTYTVRPSFEMSIPSMDAKRAFVPTPSTVFVQLFAGA